MLNNIAEVYCSLYDQLDDHIWELIEERCDIGASRIRPGYLATYLYAKLGFIGVPRNVFCNYIKCFLQKKGFVYTSYKGKPVIRGLAFKNIKDWRYPSREDPTLLNYNRKIK